MQPLTSTEVGRLTLERGDFRNPGGSLNFHRQHGIPAVIHAAVDFPEVGSQFDPSERERERECWGANKISPCAKISSSHLFRHRARTTTGELGNLHR